MSGHWLSFAGAQHENLAIPLDQLLNAYDLVRAAMGAEWIAREEQKVATGKSIGSLHPLFRELNGSTSQGLVVIAELATYLSAFTQDPSLPSVLKDLRSDKFDSTFFELAMAYRWKRAGAEIALQPVTAKGVGDLEAVIGNRRHVIECSISSHDLFNSLEFHLPLLLRDAFAAVEVPFCIGARLTVLRIPNEEWQGRLRKVAKQACVELLQLHRGGGSARIQKEERDWHLSLWVVDENETFQGAGDATIVHRVLQQPRPPGRPAYKLADDSEGRETARLFLHLPPKGTPEKNPIVEKLKREARQLRGVADARIVMLDVSSIASDVMDLTRDHVIETIDEIIAQIPEMSCVWLMSRRWSTALRFQYRALCIHNSASIYQVPEAFFEQVGALEWRYDFITGREILSKGVEEDLREYKRRSRPRE